MNLRNAGQFNIGLDIGTGSVGLGGDKRGGRAPVFQWKASLGESHIPERVHCCRDAHSSRSTSSLCTASLASQSPAGVICSNPYGRRP